MVSSGMLRRVALVRTDVSEELSASFIRVTRIGKLGKTLAVTSNRHARCEEILGIGVVPSSPILVTLMKEELNYSETSVLTRATRRNIPDDTILQNTVALLLSDDMMYYIVACRTMGSQWKHSGTESHVIQ
jgi:hypothetical protein